ncbi:hypothetical protein [Deinococcus aerophilus]|uniref:DUF8082 domain-containing protein n=1 Tax=Deinococcus aerophilus TaxID=522488 RepID=A0ABQ2GPL4_9DEIO|nr:hypothetical protein [Deinococcus aerophilus]GGM05430.1 hypothetical protein GCM10010841_12310 [Deinococcus aerophilus]
MSPLRWPEGLSDTTALPFHVWRIMDLINGERSAEAVARLGNLSVTELQRHMEEAQRWISRARQHEQPVTPELIRTVTQCLTLVVGPMAALMVDEALDEPGRQASVSALLSELAGQLSPEQLQAFARQLRERGLA